MNLYVNMNIKYFYFFAGCNLKFISKFDFEIIFSNKIKK